MSCPKCHVSFYGLKLVFSALQRPLPEISESPWWEEGQSLSKPPPVSREGGQPGQYWQGQVTGVGGFQRGQADFQAVWS